ncbi:MAG TPA: T9SS type A sorting domain-containing protein [Bacteroidia bacterium]|nr:T9SS type A sorting domain-containing protein [Bacteroidia bacterium]
MKKLTFVAAVILPALVFAQVSTPMRIPPAGVSAPPDEKKDWNPVLVQTVEADEISDEADPRIKDSLAALYRGKKHPAQQAQRTATQPGAPVMGINLNGNGFNNSTPNDNEVAIANNGHLISVQNSNIFRYRSSTGTVLGVQSLTSWAITLGNSATKYDPKVIYDPEADRFILVCLAGYSSGSTHIMIGFSQTDSANGAYNLYQVPGNPFNDSLWSDYPMISVNHNELFVTVNLLHDNMTWQAGFVQTVIWQLNKWDGYAGDTLRTELHSGINFNGRNVRNLCPVEGGGNTFAGPDMYFLSERNLDAANDTVFLVHVADTANSPVQQVTVTALVSNRDYFMPPNARQPGGTGNLATNDSRILGAFIQNGIIQYVSNTMDTSTGTSAVYHGMIANVSSSPSLTANMISDTSLDFGYPNIAYAGYGGPADNTAMIVFLYSDTITFPGVCAVVSDGSGNYSTRTTVKAGLSYINVLSGDERWGDYSGIQRKFDELGTCWVNGMWATTNHQHATWVAQLGVSNDVGISAPAAASSAGDADVFPNPFAESVGVKFFNPQAQVIRFAVYDVNGKCVDVLLQDKVNEGDVSFSFSPKPLAPGIYFMRAETADGNVLFTKKIARN